MVFSQLLHPIFRPVGHFRYADWCRRLDPDIPILH